MQGLQELSAWLLIAEETAARSASFGFVMSNPGFFMTERLQWLHGPVFLPGVVCSPSQISHLKRKATPPLCFTSPLYEAG